MTVDAMPGAWYTGHMTTTTTARPAVTHPVIRLTMPDGTTFQEDTEGYVVFDGAALRYEIRELMCRAIRAGHSPTDLAEGAWDCLPEVVA
jgi:hypothetical protein